jgi:hypothetical protein
MRQQLRCDVLQLQCTIVLGQRPNGAEVLMAKLHIL